MTQLGLNLATRMGRLTGESAVPKTAAPQAHAGSSPAPSANATPQPRNRIARATDPETSRLAADEITRSGARDAQAAEVLRRLREHPGSTSMELAGLGLDRYAIARRLPELERLGLVRRGDARTCQTGRLALTWWPQ